VERTQVVQSINTCPSNTVKSNHALVAAVVKIRNIKTSEGDANLQHKAPAKNKKIMLGIAAKFGSGGII
jgi:hypothetical protein